MYKELENFKNFLENTVCKRIKLKQIIEDECGKYIYQRVPPNVYIFDELISYNETKMPYIKIYASEQSNIEQTILNITLDIFVKNDGIYSKKYDEQGNELADYKIEVDDEVVWRDAIVLAEMIKEELLNLKFPVDFVFNNDKSIEITPAQTDYTGNGIAQISMKFDLTYLPAPITSKGIDYLF